MPSNRGGTRERRPGQVDQPVEIREWFGESAGQKSPVSGDATPRYGETTTATPKDGSDGEDVGMDYTTEQGALEGFDDNRNGFRKFFDGLSGRPSMAGTLNAQLALNRDTTAQQLQSKLAEIGATGSANTNTALAIANNAANLERQKLDYARQLEASGINLTPEQQQHAASQGFDPNTETGRIAYHKHNITQADLDAASTRLKDQATNEAYSRSIAASAQTMGMTPGAFAKGPTDAAAINKFNAASDADQSASRLTTARNTGLTTGYNAIDPADYRASALATLTMPVTQQRSASVIDAAPGHFLTVNPYGQPHERIRAAVNPDVVNGIKAQPPEWNIEDPDALAALRNAGLTQPAKVQPATSPQPAVPSTTAKVLESYGSVFNPPSTPTQATGLLPNSRGILDTVGRALGYGGLKAIHGISDALYMPPQNSQRYQEIMADRQGTFNRLLGVDQQVPTTAPTTATPQQPSRQNAQPQYPVKKSRGYSQTTAKQIDLGPDEEIVNGEVVNKKTGYRRSQ